MMVSDVFMMGLIVGFIIGFCIGLGLMEFTPTKPNLRNRE